MSVDGNEFTYVNQLASSDRDASARSEWFEVSSCPPNLTRLFGSLGGYLWDYGSIEDEAFVNVHLYTSATLTATLTFNVNGHPVSLQQMSQWPREGTVSFRSSIPESMAATIRRRLPLWCKDEYALEPRPSSWDVSLIKAGYLSLSHAYVAANPSFSIQIGGFKPRYVTPHPYTNQGHIDSRTSSHNLLRRGCRQ